MRTTFVVILAAAVSVARAGDEPQKADPRAADRWKPGEVVTADVLESTASTITVARTDSDEKPVRELATRLAAKFVQRCVEAGAEGRLVRSLVRIDAWSMNEDHCLEGALVETSPAGWKLLSSRSNPSRSGRTWLDTRFAADGRGFSGGLAELGAPGPVAAGDSWTADPPQIAFGLAQGAVPLALPDRKWKFVVAEIAGMAPKVTFDETFALEGDAKQGATVIRVAKGSSVHAHGWLSGTPGAWHRTGRIDEISDTDLRTSSGGVEITMLIRGEERETWDAGGAAPEMPAAAGRAIGTSETWKAGDACVENGSEHVVLISKPVGNDGRESPPQTTEVSVAWRAEVECLEADAAGAPRVIGVAITEWKATQGKEDDESLAGAALRVTRTGFKITEGGQLSDSARTWLRTHYGEGGGRGDVLRAAMSPVMLVAAGQSWQSDPADTSAAIRSRFGWFPVPPGTVRGKVTLLDGADVPANATFEYEIDADVGCVADGRTDAAEVLSGGRIRVKGSASGPALNWTRLGSLQDETRLSVAVPGQDASERLQRLALTEERTIARSPLSAQSQAARALNASAVAKFTAGDFDGAIADCTRAVEADPRCAKAWYDRGRARSAKKDAAGAADDYTRAIAVRPRYADAYVNRGSLRLGAGDVDAAIADFSKAIEVAPRSAIAWFDRGVARAAKGDVDGAIEDYTKCVEVNPRYADAWNNRGILRFGQGMYAAAVADYTKAIDLDPRDAKALYNRANAKFAQDDVDGAIEDCTKAIDADPLDSRGWYNRARAREGKDDADGAIADYTKAIELNPRYAAALNNRGILLNDRGDYAGAIRDYEKALEIEPGHSSALTNRGNVRHELGDVDAAIADWTRAIEIDPKEGRAMLSLARARFRPGLPPGPVAQGIRDALAAGRGPDYPRLWLWLARTQAGEGEAATKELTDHVAARKSGDGEDWYLQLAALLAGTVTEDAVIAAAKSPDARTSGERLCEATFYAGMSRAVREDMAGALPLLDRCLATGVRNFTEFTEARHWRPALMLGGVTKVVPGVGAAPRTLSLVSPDPKGPAARAGLRDGDVIATVDGRPATRPVLDGVLLDAAPGTKVRVEVLRDGATVAVDVTLGVWK